MSEAPSTDVVELDLGGYLAAIPGLTALTLDAIGGGASVNFLAGASSAEVASWWEARTGSVAAGLTTPFIARHDGRIVGSTLLMRSGNQNSPHRAEIGKVIVLRAMRRQGIARALMAAAEARARADGRWMLVLDTETGSDAESLYRALGWNETGVVPDYAMLTDGRLSPATFFWKDLR